MEEYKNYIKKLYKSLKNFQKNCPVKFQIIKTPTSVLIEEKKSGKLKSFDINISYNIKNFIHEIKNWLSDNYYPILICREKKNVKLSKKEIENNLEQGFSLEDIFFKKNYIYKETKFKVEKVLPLKNNIFIKNIDTQKIYMYEMTIPVSIFLEKVKNWEPEYSYNFFIEHSRLVRILD